MKTEHDSFLAFYLTQDDESAIRFKESRFSVGPYEVPDNEEVGVAYFFTSCGDILHIGNDLPLCARL